MNERIAGYQLEIDRLKDQREKIERKAQGTGTQMIVALLGIILGVLLAVFGGDAICATVGVILALAGILAVITQYLKRMNAGEEARKIERQIENYRQLVSQELKKAG